MKTMKVPRGTARTLRRAYLLRGWRLIAGAAKMLSPSSESMVAMLADQKVANRKLGILLFMKPTTTRVSF